MPKGFTLVELLISVAIMSILAAIGYVTYGQSQIVARDARRKQDLRSISTALELYRQKNNHYPCINNSTWIWQNSTTTPSNFWIIDKQDGSSKCGYYNGTSYVDNTLDVNYINKMPIDLGDNNWSIIDTSMQTDINNSTKRGYVYGFNRNVTTSPCPSTLNGNYYVLMTNLENAKDAESNDNKKYKWCDNSTRISPDTTGNPNLFVISSQ